MLTIAKFLVINIVGFFSFTFIFLIADKMGLIPSLPEHMIYDFKMLFMGGSLWAWVVGAALSILYLILKGKMRLFFYFMPLVLPVLYASGVLMFYN